MGQAPAITITSTSRFSDLNIMASAISVATPTATVVSTAIATAAAHALASSSSSDTLILLLTLSPFLFISVRRQNPAPRSLRFVLLFMSSNDYFIPSLTLSSTPFLFPSAGVILPCDHLSSPSSGITESLMPPPTPIACGGLIEEEVVGKGTG